MILLLFLNSCFVCANVRVCAMNNFLARVFFCVFCFVAMITLTGIDNSDNDDSDDEPF